MRKITPYNIIKGLRYLKHFGPKEFLIRLQERLEPEDVPYGPWYEAYRPSGEEITRQKDKAVRLAGRIRDKMKDAGTAPLFSVLVPVYHTPERYLRDMIGSVLAQTFRDFELCLANASPGDKDVSRILAEYAGSDARVRVKDLPENKGIAGNTNAALGMASGNYAVFLDHDDMLDPCALYHLALYLDRYPDAGLVYTDEDKISEDGKEHFQPNLKPDYDPELLCANNYICHLLCVHRETALALGGMDSRFDGAQDHEFILRCAEYLEEKGLRIGHVPEILYHWRVSASSTSDNPASKQYAYEAGRKAVEEHLERVGTPARVSLKKDYGFYRAVYPVHEEALVSILIPNRDQAATLKKCLDSIREKTSYRNYEILIIENNSREQETFSYYKSIASDRCRIVTWKGSGFNYSALNNFGFSHARGKYLVCLNNDIEVITERWLEELLGVCACPKTGIVGARLYYPDRTIQHAGIVIGIGGIAGSMFVGMDGGRSGYMHKAQLMQNLSAVTAACMMVRRDVWEKIGGFEEELSVAFNDVDFCLRAGRAGFRTVYDPYAEMIHWESKSRGKEDSKEKVRRFQREIEFIRTRWEQLLKDGDPYYNKNLSLSKWNYSLRSGAHMREGIIHEPVSP